MKGRKRVHLPDGLEQEIMERYDGSTSIIDELMKKYNITERHHITHTAKRLGKNTKSPKSWKEGDLLFLQDNWHKGREYCAKKLNRTVVAVQLKAKRLGLGGVVRASGCFTAREVAEIMGIDSHCITRWKDDGLLKGKTAKINSLVHAIELKDLLKFLEEHQELWNSQKMTCSLWITEPEWMIEKRKRDSKRAKREAAKWTKEEDKRLISLFKSGAYTHREIGELLGRSSRAIQRRASRLDIWGTGEYIGNKERVAK